MEQYLTLFILALGLSMDAFAVSVCNGLCISDLNKKRAVFIPSVFGIMQGVMPIIGFFLGTLFLTYIESFDHYIAFGLLLLIGGKMLFDGIKSIVKREQPQQKQFSVGGVILQGVATSIDALAVGISLIALPISIWIDATVIAVVTFIICLVGIFLGKQIDKLLRGKTEIADIIGGSVLILIGIKILIEHLIG